VGKGQARAVAAMMLAAGLEAELHADLARVDRVVVGTRPGARR
jgi:hypothetical protein